MRKADSKGRVRFVITLVFLALIGSFVWVLSFRFVNPVATHLMRAEQARGISISQNWKSLGEISPALIQAVVVAEDQKFCDHFGFDFEAVKKARRSNAQNGALRGASTITMQTAKNVFLWPDRNILRKTLEGWFTVLIEASWSKSRTIEIYLNVAEWGPGIFGAEAASQYYFGRSASTLSSSQAARLAAILPSPKKWTINPPGPYVYERARDIRRQANQSGLYLTRCLGR